MTDILKQVGRHTKTDDIHIKTVVEEYIYNIMKVKETDRFTDIKTDSQTHFTGWQTRQ